MEETEGLGASARELYSNFDRVRNHIIYCIYIYIFINIHLCIYHGLNNIANAPLLVLVLLPLPLPPPFLLPLLLLLLLLGYPAKLSLVTTPPGHPFSGTHGTQT